jgi:hypothetical protein
MQRIVRFELRVISSWVLVSAVLVILSVDGAASAASFRFPDDKPADNQAEHHSQKPAEKQNSIRFPDADKHVDDDPMPQTSNFPHFSLEIVKSSDRDISQIFSNYQIELLNGR